MPQAIIPDNYSVLNLELESSAATDQAEYNGSNGMRGREESKAATSVQKVFRSYRTRRKLADTAVVAEVYWLQAIEYARLRYSTVTFFDYSKPEAVIARWCRVGWNAHRVGQGLAKDGNALMLAFQHWIEAIDPRHRYGHNLHFYFEEWRKSLAGQPFFHWLDVGEGRDMDLKECPRSLLQKQCIKYLGPVERMHYEYEPTEGKIVHKKSRELLDTSNELEDDKWIFVMSTSNKLYVGQKTKGHFHHSSFLAGGATLAAGRLSTENGVLKSIWDDSGHYCPSQENLNNFLVILSNNGVDLGEVQVNRHDKENKVHKDEVLVEEVTISGPPEIETVSELNMELSSVENESIRAVEGSGSYKRTLSGGLRSPKAEVPREAILERINSKKQKKSYHLGDQLSNGWSSGVGPRIQCIADYPPVVRVEAMEFVKLSPRVSSSPSSSQ